MNLLRPHLFLVVTLLFAGVGFAADPAQFSAAENSLFVTPHLGNISKSTTLQYRYKKQGSLEEPANDKVIMQIDARGDRKTARVDFLSGARQLVLPEIEDVTSNPVILYFLEHDVRDMRRLTKGSSNYYRKRIRMAFADDATVTPVTIGYAGKQVPARQIRIAPYVNDPARSRFEKFAGKTYLITLSDQVPGGVYELQSTLTDSTANTLVIQETLTLQ